MTCSLLQALWLSLLFPRLVDARPKYMIEFRDGTNSVEHTRWVRNIHRRNLAKRGEGAAGTGGVQTVFRQLNGYIGDFDDLTVEEIRAHADVSYRSPVKLGNSSWSWKLTSEKVVNVEEDQAFEPHQLPSLSSRALVSQPDSLWGLVSSGFSRGFSRKCCNVYELK